MDWSIFGREAKKVVKDVIDQSLGTHFFSSSKPKIETATNTVATTDTTNVNTPPVPSQEEQKIKEQEQIARANAVRVELDAAIAAQRQKRQQQQQQVEQLRQETIVKSGVQVVGVESGGQESDSSKSVEKLDAKVLE